MIIIVKNRNTQNPQRGIALLAAVIALMLIGAITAGMVILSSTETNISSNFRDEQLAFFSSKAGIEEARDRLRKSTAVSTVTDSLRTPTNVLPTTLPSSANANSVLYIINPANGETVAPWGSSTATYVDDEICNETNGISCTSALPSLTSCSSWCKSVNASSVYTASPVFPWKWVRITLKQNNALTSYPTNGKTSGAGSTAQVWWNGTNEVTTCTPSPCAPPDNLPVYVLTALAVTPSGSRRMVQTEIAEDTLSFTAPGPLTLDGPAPNFSNPSDSHYAMNGTDQGGCGASATSAQTPAIVVTNNAAENAVTNAITGQNPNRSHNYTGVDGNTPDVNTGVPANLQTVSSLQTLMSTIKNNVTQPVLTPTPPATAITNIANPGTAANPQIIYVNGDVTLSGAVTGYGILVVTGTLTTSGNVGWNGLVFVVGKGVWNGNGGGSNIYNGSVIVAKTVDASGNPLSTLGSPTYNFNGGGGNGINYATGCIDLARQLSTFHVNVIRELMR
jgi:Tfp pilus assembly protein PilX